MERVSSLRTHIEGPKWAACDVTELRCDVSSANPPGMTAPADCE